MRKRWEPWVTPYPQHGRAWEWPGHQWPAHRTENRTLQQPWKLFSIFSVMSAIHPFSESKDVPMTSILIRQYWIDIWLMLKEGICKLQCWSTVWIHYDNEWIISLDHAKTLFFFFIMQKLINQSQYWRHNSTGPGKVAWWHCDITCRIYLTYLPLNKMAVISHAFSIQISLKFVPKCPIHKKSALVQVMAWRRTGDKPLPEPMLTQFTGAYMQH